MFQLRSMSFIMLYKPLQGDRATVIQYDFRL